MKQLPVRKMTYLALLAAASLAVYGFESLLPVPVPIPGFRLGLSNVVILAVLRKSGWKDASLVLLVRVLLAALLFGSPVSLLYSAVGGAFCLLVESLLERLFSGHFLPLTSLWGGISHNLGQFAVAFFLLGGGVMVYLPYLALMGAATGLFVGAVALFLVRKLPFPE